MRKIIYAVILTLFSAASFVACTEETVTPRTEDNSNGGGAGSADPIPPPPGK